MELDRIAILISVFALIMCIITFLLFGIDKRRAIRHMRRIPESTLLLCSFLVGAFGGLLAMPCFHHKTRKWKFRLLVPTFAIIQLILFASLLWASFYYPADSAALAAMESDPQVTVSKTATGWLFDGPSDSDLLIFYPGAKVEETAYAPLLHQLAADTMDVFLVKMPFRLAFLDNDRGASIAKQTGYEHYYYGGHSLGGAMAADYVAGNESAADGLLLLAAYPVRELPADTDVLLIYGSEDCVLNMSKVEAAKSLVPGNYREFKIEGGNHAQFGNYGKQKGDGEALLSVEEQQEETIRRIRDIAEKDGVDSRYN